MRGKRVFKRDWDDSYLKKYYEAPFPFDIPGYKIDRKHSKMAVTQATPLLSKGSYGFTFDIAGLPDFLLENVTLWNDTYFNIPDGDTGEEMKQAMEAITPQDIAKVLLTCGYEPVENNHTSSACRFIKPVILEARKEKETKTKGDNP